MPKRALKYGSMWHLYEELLTEASRVDIRELYIKFLQTINDYFKTATLPKLDATEPSPNGTLKYEAMWSHYDELLAEASATDLRKLNFKFVKVINDHFDKA